MNIVHYKGHEYFNYMKYYDPNDINIFIGGRGTGKTYSVHKNKYYKYIMQIDYDVENNIFIHRDWHGRYVTYKLCDVPVARGFIFNFIHIEDYLKLKEEISSYEVTHTIE